MVLGFITVGQRIDMRIVEQALAAITPWETLGADAQIIVFNKFSAWLVVTFLMAQIGVDHAQSNGWNSDKEGQFFP